MKRTCRQVGTKENENGSERSLDRSYYARSKDPLATNLTRGFSSKRRKNEF